MKYIVIILLLTSSLALAESRHPVLEEHNADTTTEAFLNLSKYDQIKLLENIIARYKKEGIEVKFTSAEYLHMIDNLLVKNPDYAKIPLGQIFRMILEEDWSFGNKNSVRN